MEREAAYSAKETQDKVHFLIIRIKNTIVKRINLTTKNKKKRKSINNKGKTITSIFCY
jgi:hypothetical protein